jgi:peptidoglycan/xylan/chitin deacetylase (PgdA/CDA1 family)
LYFKNTSPNKRNELQNILEDQVKKNMTLPFNEMLRREEIEQASHSGMITFGGHTASHVNMAQCTAEELRYQLDAERDKLKAWTNQEIKWFAYPFGKSRYLNELAIESVRKAGFGGALTIESGYVNRKTDLYRIPRIPVDGNWDRTTFRARFLGANIHRISNALKDARR